MKTRIIIMLIIAFGVSAPYANGLVTRHGREPIHGGWDKGVDAIVNHLSRVSGSIGPFGPSARFHYSGDAAIFNDILARYGTLSQKGRTLYLRSEAGPAVEGFKAGESHDFDLSITVEGQCFLHLFTLGRIRLEDLKIPDGVTLEVMPPTGLPSDPEQRAKIQAEQKRVEAFVAAHKAKSPVSKPTTPTEVKF